MTFYYEVYHQANPSYKVKLAFEEEQSIIVVKGKACNLRLFNWEDYSQLRVRKAKLQTDLKQYVEVRTDA